MASSQIAVPVDFLLSRDELLYILSLLSVATIPGLEDDPAGAMTPEQQAVALRVAGRALQARELAAVRDGETVLQNNLLAAVATCAFGQRAIFANHWPIGQELPTPLFAHIADNNSVIHTRPADVLHFLSLKPVADILAQILAACELSDTPTTVERQVKLPSALLPQLRQLAEAGAKADATNLLVAQGNGAQDAQALVDLLAGPYRTTSLQLARQRNGQSEHQDGLLLQGDQANWMMTTANGDAANLQIRNVTRANIQEWLTAWLTS
jgi:hypothetical protein